MRTLFAALLCCLTALIGSQAELPPPSLAQQGSKPSKPHKVTIAEEKAETNERFLPVDPRIRIAFKYYSRMSFNVIAGGKKYSRMSFNVIAGGKKYSNDVISTFLIDGNIYGLENAQLQTLPDGPGNKKRSGGQAIWKQGDIRITMSVEVVPGKPSRLKPGEPIPRRMDTLLVKYTIENTGKLPHKVGCRMIMDVDVLNDQALFASPTTHPKQILNGVVLEGKLLPAFFEALQRPDLDNPGEKSIFTLKLGSKLEGPNKAVLTNLSAANSEWDAPPQEAGDSACVFLWPAREIQPGGKRECAYGYGQGIACTNDPQLAADFGGSFEPGKRFTITAHVTDPFDGQALTLLLPKGIERIEGKTTQVVPTPLEGSNSIVMWRCRLLELGTHPIRIRSSTGETKTWMVTVSRPD